MKSLSTSSLAIGVLACAFFIACNPGDQDVVPQMDAAKAAKPVAQPAPAPEAAAPAEDEPQIVSLKNLNDKPAPAEEAKAPAEEVKAPAEAPAPAPVAPSYTGSNQPQASGQYVIQVSVKPTKKSANTIVNKLAENNIKAYLAAVENPADFEGTYYRVRVGYFSSYSSAKAYAKDVLSPLGFDWWVDNRSNDDVGNPPNEGYESSYEESNNSQEEAKPAPAAEPAPAAKPAPAPAAQPAPAAKPAPAPAAQPAPAAKPAPAPAAQPAPAAKPAPAPAAQPAPAAKPAPAPAAQPAPAAKPAPAPAAKAEPVEEEVVEEIVEEFVDSKSQPVAKDVEDDWE